MNLKRWYRQAVHSVLLFVLLAGCAAPVTPSPSTPEPRLSPTVKGCTETDQGMASRVPGDENEQEPAIEVIGDTLRYTRALQHQCCRKVEFEQEFQGAEITLYEVWSGEGCRCECFSEIQVDLEFIPAGNYLVRVYERGTQPGSCEAIEQKLLISVEISIP
ncbi:MAG: hypothetical protein Q7U34_03165 [Anaerolineales bacterium]|nr:hypothetical protein [Anaerolineales bacterium]